jgi:hypothetical protein
VELVITKLSEEGRFVLPLLKVLNDFKEPRDHCVSRNRLEILGIRLPREAGGVED